MSICATRKPDAMHINHTAVTVIVVNWNAGELLERCIDSLMKQNIAPHEIFIVDNASTDGSLQAVRKKYRFIKIIDSEKNIGFAAANNLAIRQSSSESEWLAFINPDAFPQPDWLETLLTEANNHTDYTFFGSRLMDASSEHTIDGTGDVYHLSGLVWRGDHGLQIRSENRFIRDIFSPCAAAAMFRKDALLAAGGFDEDYFCYVEDVDLGFRLRLMGQKCLYVPDSVVHHVGSAITGKRSDFSVYHGHRNLVWTYVKNMPGILFWLFLPLHFLLNLASIIWFTARGQGRVILRAKKDAILGLPAMWSKRKIIQSKRVVSIRDVWSWLDKTPTPFSRR